MPRAILLVCCFLASGLLPALPAGAAGEPSGELQLQTRFRMAPAEGDGPIQPEYKSVAWDPARTAVIVCDMWDTHWCNGAAARVAEMAPRMNDFLTEARRRGALIIHAPSGCMEAYADSPARARAQQAPAAKLPDFLKKGGQPLDSEKDAVWPVDQSDGGCACTPPCEHGRPWKRQIDTIEIDPADAISDSGVEIGNLLAARGVDNVLMVGVHTNMCVVRRPFGLRNLVRLGKNVLLVRDLTDAMYNPRMAPHVSHLRGTELVVDYIEQYICPTTTSSDLLGGPAFRFREDKRPHVSIIVSDDHYQADKTLPVFADLLRSRYGCYCTVLHGEGGSNFPRIDELQNTDVAVLLVRRLTLPKEQLDKVRAYIDRGGPLVGLRTASHGFCLRKGEAPEGADQWPEFDAEVLGGNYQNHGPNDAGSDIAIVEVQAGHPILAGVRPAAWHSVGSLYFTAPVKDDATVLMTGKLEDRVEPVTWVRTHRGGRVCYSSLGHPDDFQLPQFRRMLVNAIFWAMEHPVPKQ